MHIALATLPKEVVINENNVKVVNFAVLLAGVLTGLCLYIPSFNLITHLRSCSVTYKCYRIPI